MFSLFTQRKETTKELPISNRLKNLIAAKTDYRREVVVLHQNVGIMERDNYSILKTVMGKKLPLKLSETSSASEIKILATDKHASHNQNFCGLEDYVLLYPDGKEVVTLPETPTGTGEKKGKQFTLCEYKMELGKPYSQILFYLCIESEFKEAFDNNCEIASSAEFKNQAKSIPSILENSNWKS